MLLSIILQCIELAFTTKSHSAQNVYSAGFRNPADVYIIFFKKQSCSEWKKLKLKLTEERVEIGSF